MGFGNFIKRTGIMLLSATLLVSSVTGCGNKSSEKLVITIDDYKVYMDEAIWYIYLIEKELKTDAELYKENNNSSYWESSYNESATVEDTIKDEVIDEIIYYEILSNQAKKTGSFEVEDDGSYATEAEKMMEEINGKLEKKGLTQEGYEKVLAKIGQTNLYYESAIELYEVDKEKIKEENPYNDTDYEDMEEYNEYIDSLADNDKAEQFYKDYNQLISQYDIKINDKVWNKVKIGELADLIE